MIRNNSTPWETPQYHVSPYNWDPEVRGAYAFREPFLLQDFTFAKMDHMEGTRLYSPSEYVEIARLLEEVGVRETVFMTAHHPGTPKDVRAMEGLRAVAKAGVKMRLVVWGWFAAWASGEYRERIERMAADGAQAIGLSALPPHILEKFRLARSGGDFDERYAELPKAIELARKKGLDVYVSIGHAGRQRIETELIDRINYYVDHGAVGVLLADSKGAATPDATKYFVRKVREGLARDIAIFYHAHDNFGSGTALALAAATAGAWPQVTVNGLADRGFASLEEVAMSLELLYGVRTGLRLDKLQQLSRTIERITGVINPPNKAITGDFINIPGLVPGYIGVLQGKSFLDLEVMTPYELEVTGMRPRLVMTYGLLCNESVSAKLEAMGLPTDESTVASVRVALRSSLDALGNKFPVMLSDSEVELVCAETVSAHQPRPTGSRPRSPRSAVLQEVAKT